MLLRLLRSSCLGVSILLALPAVAAAQASEPLEFHLSFAKSVCAEPFSGRVYVMLSSQDIKEPRSGPSWFAPEPFFALDVTDWKPGETRVLGAGALACPVPLTKLPKRTYTIHAILDLDRGTRSFSTADGNGYSKAVRRELDPANTGPVKLVIDQVCKTKPFKETDRVKLVEIESKLLTEFHKRPTMMRAGVVLPKSFNEQPGKRYPAIYEIPGFGGRHTGAVFAASRNATDVAGTEMLYVVLDPDCRLGHHVFADSDNNGPCGQALRKELIPHIEKQFRGIARPTARFVTGHSSGGWSSLWLQVAYADFFGGVWSTAPDPVDFRDFQMVNIYEPGTNIFFDAGGDPRPLARRSKKAILRYKPFSDMEVVMGRGGQLFSFEAVFGPKGADGKPKPLWDRATGTIDAEVARSWERYDIRLVLERNWPKLAPKLQGKLHVYMGAEDNFYLEGATILLRQTLKQLGSDAVIEVFPGRDHGSLMDRNLRQRIANEMAGQFRRYYRDAN